MAFVNLKNKLIQVKIVYYGPGRSGKTTNLEYIYRKFHQRIKSEMVTVKTHGDRTLFFDFLPFDIGVVDGYQIKIQLYTVPGQVLYNDTRKLVLRGVDGVVFVADSLRVQQQQNMDSLKNLAENLNGEKISIHDIPLVLQYNKRDLAQSNIPILTQEEMENDLNRELGVPSFLASAVKGDGVYETLREISKRMIRRVTHKLRDGQY